MYNFSSGLGRPKTRNQWNDFYMDYNAEKKRKRSLMSESGSPRERMDTTAMNNKTETRKKKKKKRNSHGPSPIHFESDEEIKTTSKKAKKPIRGDNRNNNILFMGDHDDDIILIDLDDDDEDDDVDVQGLSHFSKEKKKDVKAKKKKKGKSDDFEFWEVPKSVLASKERAENSVKGMKANHKGKNEKQNSTKMAFDEHVEKKRKENQKVAGKEEKKKAAAAALGRRQSRRRGGGTSSDDEVVFLGESFTSSQIGLKTRSGSGSKAGSVGGMSPDMATYDEVACSTTKAVKDSVGLVSPDESSDSDDDAPLESRDSDESDSESSDEEDCDTSEDSDYIEGNSSSSSSSSEDEEEEEVPCSSEESDEEVEKQKHKSEVAEILKSSSKKAQKMQKGIDEKHESKAAQKEAEILKAKASFKKVREKEKRVEEKHESEVAEILETKEASKKGKKIHEKKHKSRADEKNDENLKTKTANPKKDKKKQKGAEEKQKSLSAKRTDSGTPQGIATRLRSRSKMEEKQGSDDASSDSSSDSEEKETQAEKSQKKPKGKLNVKTILLNTMLENEGRKFNESVTLAEDSVPKQLPLKFAFYEEDRSPEKEEWEVEIDNLFVDLQMGRLQSETSSSFAPAMVGEMNKNGDDGQPCWHPEGHLQILDEQIGIVCKHCDLVFLESKYLLPEFAKRPSRRSDRRFFLDSDHPAAAADFELDGSSRNDQTSIHAAGTVWDLVPGHIKARMYLHQRQGFEFIWNNIAGDLLVENLKDLPANGGKGCIISHAPGTGKTGLTVVFLRSFLKLFPLCRPVVIAPRSMLLTWESEFKKWDAGDVPFHNLNSNTLSGKEDIAGVPVLRGQPKGKDVNRLLKLYSWAKGSGILGITYGLFKQMAGGGSSYKEEDEKLRKILLKFPGLLVLDEGHTPRNEESNIYNTLSKVETPRRIILSGTPFQNNFHELHNTLSLVRPGFRAAGPTKLGGGRKAGKPPTASRGSSNNNNNWSSITCSILNDENERNVEQLKRIIAPLVHVHKGTILREKLPGLVITELYLKLTETQQNLQNTVSTRSFMERDNWMTLISVHPSLSPDHHHHNDRGGVKSLELDPRHGVKTRFVHELLSLCGARGERVIIFSRLLEPLALIKKQLLASQFFRWTENKEVLYMDGKIPARHRQERIRAFNDPESDAKVLLASTAACCEGINLVGGSRIVLLDVVWNPSVTRQAVSRAYRLGQTRLVYVYNLISSSFEAKKYACQAKKDRMSELVFADEGGGGGRRSGGDGDGGRDVILEAMAEDASMGSMFERIVHQPKNQQML